jgi:starvation-inducible DNA-binding protein
MYAWAYELMKHIDTGIEEQDRVQIADGLKRLLADSYTLYLQSHNSIGTSRGRSSESFI